MLYMGIKFACYFIISDKICNAVDFSRLLVEISSLQRPVGKVLSLSAPPRRTPFKGLQGFVRKAVDLCLKDLLTFFSRTASG